LFSKTGDTVGRQRALRIVRIRRTTFRGDAVADQIQLNAGHVIGGLARPRS